MAVYSTTDQLRKVLEQLFARLAQDAALVESLSKSRLILRFKITSPAFDATINGRKSPPQVIYGATHLRPDLDLVLSADTLHQILLAELRLGQAVSSGQLRVGGAVWKSFALEDLFHRAQQIYPQVLQEIGY
jgi:hypothetical protein